MQYDGKWSYSAMVRNYSPPATTNSIIGHGLSRPLKLPLLLVHKGFSPMDFWLPSSYVVRSFLGWLEEAWSLVHSALDGALGGDQTDNTTMVPPVARATFFDSVERTRCSMWKLEAGRGRFGLSKLVSSILICQTTSFWGSIGSHCLPVWLWDP